MSPSNVAPQESDAANGTMEPFPLSNDGRPADLAAEKPTAEKAATSQPAGKQGFVRRHILDGQICVLTFDRPNASANLFDRATLEELNRHLDFIAGSSLLNGLIITSAKNSIFIAGVDLHALAGAVPASGKMDTESVREIIELGQSVFNRIADLPIPTVAAIHGACVGGGYEICLACDYRVASPHRTTRLGLPETQLGLLPAWGGCTRLPRLIGLVKALDIILAGKTLPAKQAVRYGMVDELAPRELLVEVARRKITSAGWSLRRRSPPLKIAVTALLGPVIAGRLRSRLLKTTRGHYPAVLKALEVVTKGALRSVEESLKLEREAVLTLIPTEACRNLIRVFFLQERAKKLSAGATGRTLSLVRATPAIGNDPGAVSVENSRDKPEPIPPIGRAAVIGAGVMGASIAQWLSSRELRVVLRDITVEAVAKGMSNIQALYAEGVKRHLLTRLEARQGMDRISPAVTEASLKHMDLVIEAAVENMDLKRQIFQRLDAVAGAETILATNTSALSVSEIATATTNPGRVVGIHFFNPVHRMQLVEIVVGRRTDPLVVERSVRFVQQIGKLPVIVKDSPGFLVNRILMPHLLEAVRLFEEGARIGDIDEAMLDFGMPMGPLRLLDEVGIDVANHVAETLVAHAAERCSLPGVLAGMLKAGLFGRKKRLGFYQYDAGGKDSGINASADKFRRGHSAAGLARTELQTRMILLMVNEAAACLEEEIVSTPADIDFGMVMGTGFAPFRGGPLRYADTVGTAKLVSEADRLADAGEIRFRVCGLLRTLASSRRKFYED